MSSVLRWVRGIWQGLLLLFTWPLAVLAGVAGFFGAAVFTERPAFAGLVAMVAVLATAYAWLRWRGSRAGWAGHQRRAAAVGAALVSVVAAFVATRWLAFPDVEPAPVIVQGGAARTVLLGTGSLISFAEVPARGEQRGTVIYLHGGPAVPPRGRPENFLAFLADEGYRVVAYDQFGSGRSSRAKRLVEYTVERQVADLEALRQSFGTEQVVLIGSSWGAVLAGYYMAAHPARVERAVLLSPGILTNRGAHPYDYKPTASAEDERVILPPARMILAGFLARVNPDFAVSFASEVELGHHFDAMTTGIALEYAVHCKGRFVDQPPASGSRRGGGNYYANLMLQRSLKAAPDPRPALRTVVTPTLIVRGDCDYVPLSSAQAWGETLSGASLVSLPDAGHALTADAPERVTQLIRDHLRGPGNPPGVPSR